MYVYAITCTQLYMSCRIVCVCVVHMMSVIRHVFFCRNEEVSANGSPGPSRVPRSNISPGVSICALFGLTTAWALYSPNDVLAKEPRLFMVAVGIIFSNITVSYYYYYYFIPLPLFPCPFPPPFPVRTICPFHPVPFRTICPFPPFPFRTICIECITYYCSLI